VVKIRLKTLNKGGSGSGASSDSARLALEETIETAVESEAEEKSRESSSLERLTHNGGEEQQGFVPPEGTYLAQEAHCPSCH